VVDNLPVRRTFVRSQAMEEVFESSTAANEIDRPY
jgi:hypothetical protein